MSLFIDSNTDYWKCDYTSTEKLVADAHNYEYAVVWRLNGVVAVKGADLSHDHLTEMTELRAFSKSAELKVVCCGGDYVGRVRIDGSGEKARVVDEAHLLWGKRSQDKGDAPPPDSSSPPGYTLLANDRGVQLKVPFDVPAGMRAFIRVRNYFTNVSESLELLDWRFVGFFCEEIREDPYV